MCTYIYVYEFVCRYMCIYTYIHVHSCLYSFLASPSRPLPHPTFPGQQLPPYGVATISSRLLKIIGLFCK